MVVQRHNIVATVGLVCKGNTKKIRNLSSPLLQRPCARQCGKVKKGCKCVASRSYKWCQCDERNGSEK